MEDNVNIKTLEEGNIAYIGIDSFFYTFDDYSKYLETVNKFFKDTADYKHIIIDISKNGGGYADCYKYIIGLHRKQDILDMEVSALYEENKYIKPYLVRYVGSSVPLNDLHTQLQNTNKKFKGIKYIEKIPFKFLYGYEPRKDKKFWLLIGDQTFFAADQLAYVCKQIGFAKLVGINTCGGGINGGSPEAMLLPNSGLLIKFEAFYGLNPDGTCQDEFGTAPDIYTAKGKDALDTCLQEIRKENK